MSVPHDLELADWLRIAEHELTAIEWLENVVSNAGAKPETAIPVGIPMLARLAMEYHLAQRPPADDLADSAAEALQLAGVDGDPDEA